MKNITKGWSRMRNGRKRSGWGWLSEEEEEVRGRMGSNNLFTSLRLILNEGEERREMRLDSLFRYTLSVGLANRPRLRVELLGARMPLVSLSGQTFALKNLSKRETMNQLRGQQLDVFVCSLQEVVLMDWFPFI